jgi:hypothetical protein
VCRWPRTRNRNSDTKGASKVGQTVGKSETSKEFAM